MRGSRVRGISRVDNSPKRTHGWRVFLQRRGRKTVKLFSDGVWGSRQKALVAARRFHARRKALHPRVSLAERCQIKKRNNRSGIPGVCRLVQERESGGSTVYWVATCPLGIGRSRQIKFSVAKHGARRARAKAVAARRAALREVAGIALPGS